MNQALEHLKTRGFFQQCTDPDGLSRLMDEGPVTFYVGCDPTCPSLHIGHMVPFFAYRHLMAAGHKVIALIGGGTARIGDPSGKTEMRKMLSYDKLDANAASISAQLDRFLGFDGDKARPANNKDWLADLNYIDFLREIGSHFSVNRMLSFEAYKMRMETAFPLSNLTTSFSKATTSCNSIATMATASRLGGTTSGATSSSGPTSSAASRAPKFSA